ncbi:hypothetical protein L0F63_002342 [Massospora cicadina]|nr:hypothetical protein L0F63_002342 [Massospora cicadina]
MEADHFEKEEAEAVGLDEKSGAGSDSPPPQKKGRRPRGADMPKPVPYETVTVPFGQDEIETLLSTRTVDGREEFLVKYKYKSYHHVEWLSRQQVEATLNMAKSRIKKLLEQYDVNPAKFEEPFNTVHLEIDRVIDEGEIADPDTRDGYSVYVLVKWCGLAYEFATWEKVSKVEELDREKLEEFYARQKMPKADALQKGERPKAEQFIKLEASPEFKGGIRFATISSRA